MLTIISSKYCRSFTFSIFCIALSTISIMTITNGRTPFSVWFMPAANSPDYDDLFMKPELWTRSRNQLDAFVFGPGQIKSGRGYSSSLPKLIAMNAFRKIRNWALATVVGVPALKEWDCEAHHTAMATVELLKPIYAAGGVVQFLEMDEPLISALGLNVPTCRLDIDTAATELALYAKSVVSDKSVTASGVIPQFVDVEAYPSLNLRQIETWIMALEHHGFVPSAFHIDANMSAIEADPIAATHFSSDLQDLQVFLRRRQIPFGIIIWSGHDPQRSDKEYYVNAMKMVHIIHNSIGHPDRISFESWVKRGSQNNGDIDPSSGCTVSYHDYCGTNSIPTNFPENNPNVFSHTRLILDTVALMGG